MQKSFASTKGENVWTERDAEYELALNLRHELDSQGLDLRPHFGVGMSTDSYTWWDPGDREKYPVVARALDKFEASLGKKAEIDMVLRDDQNTSDQLPVFPLAAEFKYGWLYDGTKDDVDTFLQDRDKLKLLKEHDIANHVCFVLLDERPKKFHSDILSKGWDPARVYLVLVDTRHLTSSSPKPSLGRTMK